MPRGPRTGHAWRQASARVKANTIACGLCGELVDMSLKWPHPRSFSVDHIVPVNLGGSVTDLDNLRGCHLTCNSSRGDGTRGGHSRTGIRYLDLGSTRDW